MNLHKLYDADHYIEMIYNSLTDTRREYYSTGHLKRKLDVVFDNDAREYCILETNYTNPTDNLTDNPNHNIQNGGDVVECRIIEYTDYAFRRIFSNGRVIGYVGYVNTDGGFITLEKHISD